MIRAITFTAVALGCFLLANNASAQIKVVKKPAPRVEAGETAVYDVWWMSWGLKGDDGYPMGIQRFATEAEARAAAQASIDKTKANGKWAITHVLIEGEASVRSSAGPSLPSEDRIQDDTLTSLKKDLQDTLRNILGKDIENAFKKKNQDIKDAYRRAKEGKQFLVRNVSKLAQDDFSKINKLISDYNDLKTKFASEQPNPEYFAALPSMTAVSADDAKRQADQWAAARKSQDELEKEKQALDEEKARLEKVRQDSIDSGKALDQEQSSAGDPVGLVGSSWANADKNDLFGLRFIDFTGPETLVARYNVEATKFDGKWHSLGDGKAEVTLRGGTYTTSINGKKFKVSNVTMVQTKAGEPDPNVKAKLEAVAGKQRDRQASVAKYKADLLSYQERLAAYQNKLAAHQTLLAESKQDHYGPPAAAKADTKAPAAGKTTKKPAVGKKKK